MKHVVKKKEAVSPLSKKNLNQSEKIEKKTSGIAAAQPSKQNAAKNIKNAVKSAPVMTSPNGKPKVTASKKKPADVENLKAADSNSNRNAARKTAPAVTQRDSQPATKNTIVIADRTVKAKTGKAKAITIAKKSHAVKIKEIDSRKIASKINSSERNPKAKLPALVKKVSVVEPKIKITTAASPKEFVHKTSRSKTLVSSAAINRAAKTAQPAMGENPTQPKANKVKAAAVPKAVKAFAPKVKVEKTKAAPIKIADSKKIKAIEPPIEALDIPIPKPKKKRVKPLGAAVFRGIKERYDFQVFPADGEFEDAAAIYIISRRVVDKNKRAHHKMVCIGQANSVLNELKKHRKDKCFKQHQVNAISVLREENEQKRLKIEADLKSAHTIPCPHA